MALERRTTPTMGALREWLRTQERALQSIVKWLAVTSSCCFHRGEHLHTSVLAVVAGVAPVQVAASPEAAGLSHFDSETFGHEP